MSAETSVRWVSRPAKLGGELAVPGDKSISHRSLILNAMAHGSARITGLSNGEDVMSTLDCLRRMGAEITQAASRGNTPSLAAGRCCRNR